MKEWQTPTRYRKEVLRQERSPRPSIRTQIPGKDLGNLQNSMRENKSTQGIRANNRIRIYYRLLLDYTATNGTKSQRTAFSFW